jgi:hypothetical protein
MQNEVNGAKAAVDGCDTGLAAAEAGAREQETTLSIGESRHNECELEHAQAVKKAENDCQALTALIDTLEAPASVASVDLNDTNAVQAALEDNYKFYQEHFQKFTDEDGECSTSHTAAENKAQQCETDRANLEGSFCSLKSARDQVCSDYSACFEEKKVVLARVVDDVKAVEEHIKNNFKTLSCLGQTVMQDMPNQRPSCNNSAVDTTPLDVFYPSTPAQGSCSAEVSTSWNYSADLCDGPIAEGGAETVANVTESSGAGGNQSLGNQSLVQAKKAVKPVAAKGPAAPPVRVVEVVEVEVLSPKALGGARQARPAADRY